MNQLVHFAQEDEPNHYTLDRPGQRYWVGNVLVSLDAEHHPVALGAVYRPSTDNKSGGWVGAVFERPRLMPYDFTAEPGVPNPPLWVAITGHMPRNFVRQERFSKVFQTCTEARGRIWKATDSVPVEVFKAVNHAIILTERHRRWSL